MPSKAYQSLEKRLKDIEQLMDAHSALTQFRLARIEAKKAGGDLPKILKVVTRLVSPPGPGRRAGVEALNRAAMVLLCAHLEGYIEDLYAEAARALLGKAVKAVDVLVKRAQDTFSNPTPGRINQLFQSLGIPKILDSLHWEKASNASVRRRLGEYVETRNRIAHGSQEHITKPGVEQFARFVKLFASRFDDKVRGEVKTARNKAVR